MKDEPWTFFNDGYFAAKTAKHLREFQADIASANDHEMRRQFFKLKYGGIGEKGNAFDAGKIGHDGAVTYVEENVVGAECLRVDIDLMAGDKASRCMEDCAVLHSAQPFFDSIAGLGENHFLAGYDSFHVDLNRPVNCDAKIAGAPCEVGSVRACHHGLGGNATGVDAGAAEEFSLDHGNSLAGLGQTASQRRTCLSGPDDDGVKVIAHNNPRLGRISGFVPAMKVAGLTFLAARFQWGRLHGGSGTQYRPVGVKEPLIEHCCLLNIPSVAKATLVHLALSARLKPCPFKAKLNQRFTTLAVLDDEHRFVIDAIGFIGLPQTIVIP